MVSMHYLEFYWTKFISYSLLSILAVAQYNNICVCVCHLVRLSSTHHIVTENESEDTTNDLQYNNNKENNGILQANRKIHTMS